MILRVSITKGGELEMETTLDDLLEEWAVHDPDMIGEGHPKGMYAVSNDTGIRAYFADEADAFLFRLMKINIIMNT